MASLEIYLPGRVVTFASDDRSLFVFERAVWPALRNGNAFWLDNGPGTPNVLVNSGVGLVINYDDVSITATEDPYLQVLLDETVSLIQRGGVSLDTISGMRFGLESNATNGHELTNVFIADEARRNAGRAPFN